MTRSRSFLRRELLGLFASVAALLGPGSKFGLGKPGDQGIGGTGAAPPEKPEEDRGIGGTGVIGTIRRFGSIYVNGLRIAYPKDVTVLRDGEPMNVAALRIGHVVRVVAEHHQGTFSTRTINVTSEVVGVVEKTTSGRLTVAGQTVVTTGLKNATRWAEGDRVAVSGLRHLNGDVIASLIEPSTRELTRVSGPVVEALDGGLHIAGVKIEGVDRALLGERAIVEGHYDAGRLQATAYASQQSLFGPNVDRLSVEAYVQRNQGKLVLGSGQRVAAAPPSISSDRSVRAILTGRIGQNGQVNVDRVQVLSRAEVPGEPASHAHSQDGIHGHDGGRGLNGGSGPKAPSPGERGMSNPSRAPAQGNRAFGPPGDGRFPNGPGGLGENPGAGGIANPGFGGQGPLGPGLGGPGMGAQGIGPGGAGPGGGLGGGGLGGGGIGGGGIGPGGGPGPGRR